LGYGSVWPRRILFLAGGRRNGTTPFARRSSEEKSRRYSIYWIARGELTDEARQLVNLSQARKIR
jgi:hypothetical protein